MIPPTGSTPRLSLENSSSKHPQDSEQASPALVALAHFPLIPSLSRDPSRRLEKLFTHESDVSARSILADINQFVQCYGLDDLSIDLFYHGTKDLLLKLPVASKVYLFKNAQLYQEKHGPLEPKDLSKLCSLLNPYLIGLDAKKINRIIFHFLEHPNEHWECLDSALKIIDACGKNHGSLFKFLQLCTLFPQRSWVDFARFAKDYIHNPAHTGDELLTFYKNFDSEERKLLLYGTDARIRKHLFRSFEVESQRVGVEILLTCDQQEIGHFYNSTRWLSDTEMQELFSIPLLFDIKSGAGSCKSSSRSKNSFFPPNLCIENLKFALKKVPLFRFMQVPVVRWDLRPALLEVHHAQEIALVQFLFENFAYHENPMVKKILSEDLSYLLKSTRNMLHFKTESEEAEMGQMVSIMLEYRSNHSNGPNPLCQGSPDYTFFEENGFFIDLENGNLLISNKENIPHPEALLQSLCDSHLLFFDDFRVYFIQPVPEEVDGKLRYPIPPTVDRGGPKREFFYLLVRSLLSSQNPQKIQIDDEGFVVLDDKMQENAPLLCRQFGLLISRMECHQIPLGKLLNENTFRLLKFLKKNRAMPQRELLRSFDRIIHGNRPLNKKSWTVEEQQELCHLLAAGTEEEIAETVEAFLVRSHSGRLSALREILQSFTNNQQFLLRQSSVLELKSRFEGEGVRADFVDLFIDFASSHPEWRAHLFIKKTKEWFEKSSDEECQTLVKAITGHNTLALGQKIQFRFLRQEENREVHQEIDSLISTCAQSIDIFLDDPNHLPDFLDQLSCSKNPFNAP
jgi:hypothetical protein